MLRPLSIGRGRPDHPGGASMSKASYKPPQSAEELLERYTARERDRRADDAAREAAPEGKL